MYAVNLMRLARLAGVSQSAIARHLGIVRVQPNIWALGKRPIAEDKVAPLVAFIARAVKKRLATVLPGETIQAELNAALSDVFTENCKRYGHIAEASLKAFMAEVEAFAALSERQRQQASKREHFEKRMASMLFWLELEDTFRPLRRLLPDEEVARPVADEEELTARGR